MQYIKVEWKHGHPDEPAILYSELDDDRWERRKVEVFADGRLGFADDDDQTVATNTRLSIEPIPPLDEIAADPQFKPVSISAEEFSAIWARRKSR